MQIATAVLKAVANSTALDAIQPMKQGWYVYMKTNADHECLVQKGVTIAGRFITLQSDYRPEVRQSVKIMIKDLPLNSIGNEAVLEHMRDLCEVTSTVNYSNLWFEGKATSIHNGDHYLYIAKQDVSRLPNVVEIGGCKAHVFKPVSRSQYKRCGNEGYCASDPNCPAQATEEVQDMVEAFRGVSVNYLISLHVCTSVKSRILGHHSQLVSITTNSRNLKLMTKVKKYLNFSWSKIASGQ